MPPGKSRAPGTAPAQLPARLRSLPESEVAGIALERIGLDSDGLRQLLLVDVARQPSVAGEGGDGEVDVTFFLVGIADLDEALDDLYHFPDMVGGLGKAGGGQDVQPLFVCEEAL